MHDFRSQRHSLVPNGDVDGVFLEESVVFFLVREHTLPFEQVRLDEHFLAQVGEEDIEFWGGGGRKCGERA